MTLKVFKFMVVHTGSFTNHFLQDLKKLAVNGNDFFP